MSAGGPLHGMLESLFAAIDGQDTDAFLDHLSDDATFRFGSSPAAVGREAIAAAVNGFFATISGLSHAVHTTLDVDESVVCEGEVTYTRKDGSTITLPFVDVFGMDGDRIREYKIYMDVAPLYAETAA